MAGRRKHAVVLAHHPAFVSCAQNNSRESRVRFAGPFEEMEDAFNSGWIDFGVLGTDSVAGKLTPAQIQLANPISE